MLHKVYSSRIRRYFPANDFFRHMNNMLIKGQQAKIFVVKYKEKIIGGSVCIYSGDDAYLWFSGGMRKTYALQYPGVLAVWKALEDAHQRGFRHMEFMDVGLPFRKHGYRDFRSSLRRKTKQYPPLVPHQLELAEQTLSQVLCLNVISRLQNNVLCSFPTIFSV